MIVGYTILDRGGPDEPWRLDHVGPALTHDQAVDDLARESQNWPDLEMVVARIVIEDEA